MAESNEMEEFLKSVPPNIREQHRQGLKHRDYVLGYHEHIRQYLQDDITDTRHSLKSSKSMEQLLAMVHLLDTMQALRLNDNFEILCLNMIDFHNDTNVQPEPPNTTSNNYKDGWQMASTITGYGMQAIRFISAFL